MPEPPAPQTPAAEATSVSKIQSSNAVEPRNPEHMRYALSWTILDQFGKPIDSAVTRLLDGKQKLIDSDDNRKGVCIDSVVVKGYGKEVLYSVIPPIGEPQILTLRGPAKPADATPKTWTITVRLARRHPVEGWFIVTGNTHCNDKLADCTFTAISSPREIEVKAVVGDIVPNNGESFQITTKGGNFNFLVKFNQTEVDMTIRLADGTSTTVRMVKPIL